MSPRYNRCTFEPPIDRTRFVSWAGRAALPALLLMITSCGGAAPTGSNTDAASGQTSSTPTTNSGTADACRLLTAEEIAPLVGNAVAPGRPNAGPEVCKWNTERPDQIDVLMFVRLKGSLREQALCKNVRAAAAAGKGVPGIGEAALWTLTKSGMFDSGELEVCSSKAYISLNLSGKGEALTSETAAVALARKVIGRLGG